jgi:hypothetical protein
MFIQVMMYITEMQNLNLKYIVLWATQKRQNMTRFEYVLFINLDL